MKDKMALLEAASKPRRAKLDDAVTLSKLFASAFMDDPLFDYMVRPGARRAAALEMFFHEILRARDIPQGEVWMSSDGHACVCWLSPDARRSPGGIVQKLSWLPFFLRVYGAARFTRAMAIMEAMENNHPRERHFYLTFAAVSLNITGLDWDRESLRQLSSKSISPVRPHTLRVQIRRTRHFTSGADLLLKRTLPLWAPLR
jgi:hypothetical protein